jgi:hypothetical protein
MALLADGISFFAAFPGTGSFIFSTARPSFYTPPQGVTAGELVDGGTYSYLAQDSPSAPVQREWGHGVFTAASSTFTRNSLGGVDHGAAVPAGTPVGFSVPPMVSLTLLTEDVRVILDANTNFYVNGTTGSDSNHGLTSGTAWATLLHAWNVISSQYDLSGFTVTINVAAGSYTGIDSSSQNNGPIGNGTIIWNGANPTTTFVDTATFGNAFVIPAFAGAVNIDGFTITMGAGTDGIVVGRFCRFRILGGSNPGVIFDCTATDGGSSCLDSTGPGEAVFVSDITFKNGNGAGMVGINQGRYQTIVTLGNYIFSGTPTFGFFIAIGNSTHSDNAVYSGAVSGPWFLLQDNSALDSSAATQPPTGFSNGTSDNSSSFANDNALALACLGVIARSGLETGSNLNLPGFFGIFRDTTNHPRSIAVNDGGVIYTRQIGNNINTQTGASYTLALPDQEGIVEMNNAGANTLTVPTNASVAFPIGTKISVEQIGAGATTVAAAGGVTVHNVGALAGQYKTALLRKRATDEWTQTNGAF